MSKIIETVHISQRTNRGSHQKFSRGLRTVLGLFLTTLFVVVSTTSLVSCENTTPPVTREAKSSAWEEQVSRIVWVAYSPTTANPNKGIEATPKSIREDLAVLNKAGFTGLVTYGSSGVLGRELPTIAQSQGFQGLIMGIWDPSSSEEMAMAKAAAKNPIILGFCVGNEGLMTGRYKLSTLAQAMENLRTATGKPVTTTEIIEKYGEKNFLQLGDWVFPNVHPYFHSLLDPDAAVRWTKGAYEDIKRRSDRLILFKEVGLPTAGDSQNKLSEAAQERYYLELAKTDVPFVYFEAYDQPWKNHLPVEPHWGIFRSERTPKLLGWRLMGKEPPSST